MAAFNACITVGYVAGAALKGITLDIARDPRPAASSTCAASSGSATPSRRATNRSTTRSASRATASPEQFEEIHQTVMKTSPNYFNLSRPIRMNGSLRVGWPQPHSRARPTPHPCGAPGDTHCKDLAMRHMLMDPAFPDLVAEAAEEERENELAAASADAEQAPRDPLDLFLDFLATMEVAATRIW